MPNNVCICRPGGQTSHFFTFASATSLPMLVTCNQKACIHAGIGQVTKVKREPFRHTYCQMSMAYCLWCSDSQARRVTYPAGRDGCKRLSKCCVNVLLSVYTFLYFQHGVVIPGITVDSGGWQTLGGRGKSTGCLSDQVSKRQQTLAKVCKGKKTRKGVKRKGRSKINVLK